MCGAADVGTLLRPAEQYRVTRHNRPPIAAGLSEGLPSGTEEAELAQAEQEVEANAQLLRGLKQQNEQVGARCQCQQQQRGRLPLVTADHASARCWHAQGPLPH